MPKMRGRILGKPTDLIITPEQRTKLRGFTTGQGGYQSLCQRVLDRIKEKDGELVASVYGVDMERIQAVVARPDSGGWQDLFREILAANKGVPN